jgi:hypothetical protein
MADFDSAESLEEFKHRLNSLTEKLNNIHKKSTSGGEQTRLS